MIIGLCGHKRTGKDTIAAILVENHGFEQIALADPIKEIAMLMFGWDFHMVYGIEYDREQIIPAWGFSVRHALERIGTELGRELHSEVWIRKALRRAENSTKQGVVISDVRFHNEVKAIRDVYGIIWKVERPGFEGDAAHASEMEIDDIRGDRTIVNDGTLLDLKAKVSGALSSMFF